MQLYGFQGAITFVPNSPRSYLSAVRFLLSIPDEAGCEYALVWYNLRGRICRSHNHKIAATDSPKPDKSHESGDEPIPLALICIENATMTGVAKHFFVKLPTKWPQRVGSQASSSSSLPSSA